MKKKDEEISLVEIAALAGVHRQIAYWAVRSGEIEKARQTLGRIWVAPRGEVAKWIGKRKHDEQLRRESAERNPFFAASEAVRGVKAAFGEMAAEVHDKLSGE